MLYLQSELRPYMLSNEAKRHPLVAPVNKHGVLLRGKEFEDELGKIDQSAEYD